MAKKNDKDKKSSLNIWLEEMREKYPFAVEHFERFLRAWGQVTVGAAFAQLGESFKFISLYLNSNNAPAAVSSMDPIKSSLEVAFRNSQALSEELSW